MRDTHTALTNTGNLWQAALYSANKVFGTSHHLHSVPEGHWQAKLLFSLAKFRSSSQVTIYYHLPEKTLAVFLLLSAFQSPRGIFSGNPIRVRKINSQTYGRKPWYSHLPMRNVSLMPVCLSWEVSKTPRTSQPQCVAELLINIHLFCG